MLSDFELENLIQPFVDRQTNLEIYVLNTIADRVREIGTLSKSDVYKLKQLLKTGTSVRLLLKELNDLMSLQQKSVTQVFREAGLTIYQDAKPFYEYRAIKQVPYADNKRLQKTITAISNETAGTFKNLANSKATGFYIRNANNPQHLKFYNIQDAYQSVIDEAIQGVQTGALTFDTAMRKTLKQLTDSGLRRMYWDSGYSRRLDSVVRMNILGGIRKLNQQIQLQIADEIEADGIELSAHSFSAPDHEPVQGRIFKIREFEKLQNEMSFEDVTGTKFSPIKRPIGEWNCNHFTQAVIIAQHKPTWSLSELAELKEENKKGYTTKTGKHYTMYECRQIQRKYETEIRKAKEGYMCSKTAKNEQLAEYYKAKISDLNKQYRQFSKDCGLNVKKDRTSVPNFMY